MPNALARRTQAVFSWRESLRRDGPNAVVVREGRARWRGGRAYWLSLGYAGFLAFALWWSYGQSIRGSSKGDSLGAAAQLGHDLFSLLCYCQVGAWLFIAPILTASALAGEREKGLLEGLILSRLSPGDIVRGKMGSALGFIALLILAATPVMAVCFLMGGVSPGEFLGALALQFSTAAAGAAIGMAASAVHRRSSGATGAAIGFVFAWLIGSGLALAMWQIPRAAVGASYVPVWDDVMAPVVFSNPFLAVALLTSPASVRFGGIGLWSALGNGAWLAAVAGQVLLCAWKMRDAAKALARSPERFDDISGASPAVASPAPSFRASSASHETWQRQAAQNAEPSHEPTQGHYWQVPIIDRIRFGNAMMRRELLAAWRWPDLSVRAQMTLTFSVLFAAWLGLQALGLIMESKEGAEGVWWAAMFVVATGGLLACAMGPAGSTARERENGVWEGLRLTLLSPLQIAGARAFAPLVACAIYSSPAWILALPAAWRGAVRLDVVLLSVFLVAATWAQAACWSLWCGTRARGSQTALGMAMGGPALAWIGVPILVSMFNIRFFSPGGGGEALALAHPLVAFSEVTDRANTYSIASAASAPLIVLVQGAVTAALFGMAWRAVRRSQRAEKQSASRTS